MITIIDYGVGNLASIQNMLKKAGADSLITNNRETIEQSEKLLLPGMGAFDNCMQKFNDSGFRDIIDRKVCVDKVPLLGICIGLQMFMESSEEGILPGLGWVKGKTVRFAPEQMQQAHKIPNMGWLEVQLQRPSPLMEALEDARFYFAHSYHIRPANPEVSLLSADYGYAFTAAIEQDNLLGVQFHPEKSHRFGMKLLANFAFNY